jgi:predicted dinucleotide-binding enzyme
MTYAIIGFGAVGQALARTFARKGIEVMLASRRPPKVLTPQARELGPTVVPTSLPKALEADIIFLAVPFSKHHEVANARKLAGRDRGRRDERVWRALGAAGWPAVLRRGGPAARP